MSKIRYIYDVEITTTHRKTNVITEYKVRWAFNNTCVQYILNQLKEHYITFGEFTDVTKLKLIGANS
jgi:hypothetical protein